ncbi:DUF2499 domain-containing protein [Synechococcus sp. PCC 7336]|uniref:DUF2499 domain-containing protein n=1 Tax=Synechococcus sp. PCC 7336 TaxID=195250 RepID=UPI000347B263|nr:DUF2499 domain-containing protein [Synechococcus sp. PCC 7336]
MNALSLPTWFIHIASVVEWIAAIFLVWRFATVTGQRAWRGLAWAMLPALAGAMSALTWHFFDNSPELDWIVTLQASLTLMGNCTLALAAGSIWYQSRQSNSRSL